MAAWCAIRTIAACLVAAALLVQQVFALPSAMRMMSGADAGGFLGALCAMRSAAGETAPLPPAAPHSHFGCALCAGHAVAPAVLAGTPQLLVPVTNWQAWLRPVVCAPAPGRPFRLYGSRAPPAPG